MSGIVGLLRRDGAAVDRALLARLTQFQTFRGPHGRQNWIGAGVGLGHALFNVSGEPITAQPATLDGEVWITAHARIDAQRELIQKLADAGRPVRTECSDAELILHSYHAWGERLVEHLLGDFSFALWNARQRRLFCAVDHFGIRPFYYASACGEIVFSNTLDCVLQHPGVQRNLDETAVGDFLLFGHYQDRDRTIYAAVNRIPPAHCLIVDQDGLRVRRYWDFSEQPELEDRTPEQIVDGFRSRLLDATRDRLRTRQAAILLSGGLDSPLVAVAAVQALSADATPWHLAPYTTVFESLIPDDEERFARDAAAALRLDIRVRSGDDFTPFDWFERCSWSPPEPTNDPAYSSWSDTIASIAGDFRLVLTGIEGDQSLKASLPHHWLELARRGQWGRLIRDLDVYVRSERRLPPAGIRTKWMRMRARRFPPPLPPWLDPDFVRRANLVARWREHYPVWMDGTPRHPRADNLRRIHWSQSFDYYDAGWTGLAIEGAHPFMDLRVVEFLQRLPPVPWTMRKRLHRAAAQGVLPESVVARPKTPLAADPARAAELKRGNPPQLIEGSIAALAGFVSPSGLESGPGVDWIDRYWIKARILSLGGWLMKRQADQRKAPNDQD